ncbi:uncharacterized protein LOC114731349 [Neltuma alba]|uniref:uncharacterized protein LOC114731349 n=1 Tax=Neltuma alba TaxID=207710 RepID=UPI0010A4A7AF|nr:uncharacterized protein LOC114731349 [Prosopis alba]
MIELDFVYGGIMLCPSLRAFSASSCKKLNPPQIAISNNGSVLPMQKFSFDVKRWIGEVRGKDLTETYAWSYKRRYKTGYVWQDLLDDDLITPISDNEYVLKGSQTHPPSFETFIFGERKASILDKEIHVQVHDTEGKQLKQKQPLISEELQLERFPYFKPNSLDQVLSEISSDGSTLPDESESCKVEPDKLVDTGKHNPETSFSISLSSSSSSLSPLKGSKRFSTGASGLFRSLITCGALDPNDDVVVMLNQAHKTVSKNSNTLDDGNVNAQIRKHNRFGGSARNLGSCWNPQQEHDEARKSCDEKSTNKNKKKLGEFLNQISHKPFGGSIFSR